MASCIVVVRRSPISRSSTSSCRSAACSAASSRRSSRPTSSSPCSDLMICHGELHRRRAAVADLTVFYVFMSLGGVLGGIFSALIAPHLFVTVLRSDDLPWRAASSSSGGRRSHGLLRLHVARRRARRHLLGAHRAPPLRHRAQI